MAEPLDPQHLGTLEELALSNMWEVAALIEVLEKKGVMKKQGILDAIRELRQKNPKARTPLELEDTPENSKQHPKQVDGNVLVERILELILEAGLSSRQAREVLDRAKEAIDIGEKDAKKMLNH
ncbi:MAG: hypothetical protein VST67_01695 [Nitrospirota bacterium]|nr:hypothetical protein [Nitrospirota bacterium]